MFKPAASSRLSTSSHHAIRLRAVSAPANKASTNDHAKLVSGKLNTKSLMNSLGTLISHRITGDTLAISDRVAMTPTVQPAAAGTQRSRELDWLRRRDAVRVTDGEDIRFTYGIAMFGSARRCLCRPQGLRMPRCPTVGERSDGVGRRDW